MFQHEERLSPAQTYAEVYPTYAEYLGRYHFASRFLGPAARVLDLGCGCGYGTAHLAEAPSRLVVGLDRAAEAASYARRHYRLGGLHFGRADLRALPVKSASMDGVVAMEVIEHLPEPAALLEEARRVLRPGGVLVLSTPNGLMNGAGDKPANPFHVREFSPEQLRALLRPVFSEFALLGQSQNPAMRALQGNLGRMWHNLSLLRDELHMLGSRVDLDERYTGLAWMRSLLRKILGRNGAPPLSSRLERLDLEFRQAEYFQSGMGDWDITPYAIERAPILLAVCRT